MRRSKRRSSEHAHLPRHFQREKYVTCVCQTCRTNETNDEQKGIFSSYHVVDYRGGSVGDLSP